MRIQTLVIFVIALTVSPVTLAEEFTFRTIRKLNNRDLESSIRAGNKRISGYGYKGITLVLKGQDKGGWSLITIKSETPINDELKENIKKLLRIEGKISWAVPRTLTKAEKEQYKYPDKPKGTYYIPCMDDRSFEANDWLWFVRKDLKLTKSTFKLVESKDKLIFKSNKSLVKKLHRKKSAEVLFIVDGLAVSKVDWRLTTTKWRGGKYLEVLYSWVWFDPAIKHRDGDILTIALNNPSKTGFIELGELPVAAKKARAHVEKGDIHLKKGETKDAALQYWNAVCFYWYLPEISIQRDKLLEKVNTHFGGIPYPFSFPEGATRKSSKRKKPKSEETKPKAPK